jgi:RNA polymerase sigma-70 factor (ECF subfamily)
MSRESLDIQEFVALLIDHQELIRSYIIIQIPGSPDVRDVLQEVNLVLWEKMKDFEPGTSFGAWACTVARYKVLEHRRKEARRNGLLVFNDELCRSLAARTEEREPQVLEDRRKALDLCLSKLSVSQRELLKARYGPAKAGMAEAAAGTGRSRESLRVTLSRIRTLLMECIRRQLARQGGMA